MKVFTHVGEQWETCGNCGIPWPHTQLTPQLGIRKCPRCFDNLDNYNRERRIAEYLSRQTSEGLDRRNLDLAAWANMDEVV
jgi:hypothetical protein